MKKLLLSSLLSINLLSYTGCNQSIGIGNFSFKKVHIDMPNSVECLTVESWYENSTGVEIKTKECGSMFLSEGTYILLEDSCPFCD